MKERVVLVVKVQYIVGEVPAVVATVWWRLGHPTTSECESESEGESESSQIESDGESCGCEGDRAYEFKENERCERESKSGQIENDSESCKGEGAYEATDKLDEKATVGGPLLQSQRPFLTRQRARARARAARAKHEKEQGERRISLGHKWCLASVVLCLAASLVLWKHQTAIAKENKGNLETTGLPSLAEAKSPTKKLDTTKKKEPTKEAKAKNKATSPTLKPIKKATTKAGDDFEDGFEGDQGAQTRAKSPTKKPATTKKKGTTKEATTKNKATSPTPKPIEKSTIKEGDDSDDGFEEGQVELVFKYIVSWFKKVDVDAYETASLVQRMSDYA